VTKQSVNIHILSICLVLLTFSARAETLTEAERASKQHDYSRQTLLYIFQEEPEPTLEYTFGEGGLRTRFLFLPFMTGFENFGRAAVPNAVDPFAALGTSFPMTAAIARKTRQETRMRRELLQRVREANRMENAD